MPKLILINCIKIQTYCLSGTIKQRYHSRCIRRSNQTTQYTFVVIFPHIWWQWFHLLSLSFNFLLVVNKLFKKFKINLLAWWLTWKIRVLLQSNKLGHAWSQSLINLVNFVIESIWINQRSTISFKNNTIFKRGKGINHRVVR